MNTLPFSNRTAISAIITVSTLVFLFLFGCFISRSDGTETEMDLSFMPALNALLNQLAHFSGSRSHCDQRDKERHWRMMLTH